jgi:hypothetical protein
MVYKNIIFFSFIFKMQIFVIYVRQTTELLLNACHPLHHKGGRCRSRRGAPGQSENERCGSKAEE